jgi:hypothetical protein
MKTINQNDLERIQDRLQRGLITVTEANIEKILCERVHLVTKLSKDVRTALNGAVKAGKLGHKAKKGHLPEVYYHPSFECLVAQERNEHAQKVVNALASVMVKASELDNASLINSNLMVIE